MNKIDICKIDHEELVLTMLQDVLTEEYADANGELRWAITPSVIQHIGIKSSKVDDYGPMSKHGLSVAEKIWNFAFERNDVDALRKEHWRATHPLNPP